MSQFPRYESYKDSGVQWLGEIPSHWVVKRMKFLGDIVLGLTYSPDDVSLSKNGTLVLRSSNVQNGQLVFDDNVYVEKIIPAKMVTTENDILICSRNGSRNLIGKCALIEGEGINQTFGAFMTVFRSPYRRYLYYVLSSDLFKFQIGNYLTSTINQLTTYALGDFNVPLPNIEEQNHIVNFLDKQLAKIDALIAKQETLLNKLEEQRIALISHAVTKGLDPNVEMKDSGIEWLGEVPKHWVCMGLKKSLESIVDYRGKTPEKVESGIFLVTARNIKNGYIDYSLSQEYVEEEQYQKIMSRGLPEIGDVLLTTEAPLGEIAQIDNVNIALAQRVIKFRGKKEILDNDFLKYFMLSRNFQDSLYTYSSGSTAIGIKAERLAYLRILIPPIEEQTLIKEFIDHGIYEIKNMSSKVEQALKVLKEYRSTLITQAVTGKIDVRNIDIN